MTKYQKLLVFA